LSIGHCCDAEAPRGGGRLTVVIELFEKLGMETIVGEGVLGNWELLGILNK
jgi:hypothetical protein